MFFPFPFTTACDHRKQFPKELRTYDHIPKQTRKQRETKFWPCLTIGGRQRKKIQQNSDKHRNS